MISFDCEQNNHNSFSSITMIPGKSLPFGRLFALYGEGARPVMGAASFLGSLCEGAVKRQGRLTEGVAAGRARYRSGSKPGATPSTADGTAMCAGQCGTVWAPFPTKTTIRCRDVRGPVKDNGYALTRAPFPGLLPGGGVKRQGRLTGGVAAG